MKIKITDIAPEGQELDFELNNARLNSRVRAFRDVADERAVPPPEYVFGGPTGVHIALSLEGATVVANGVVRGAYTSPCSRCAEEANNKMEVPIRIILKPRIERGPEAARDEDLQFGFYSDQEIDCAAIAEEFLVLALPYTVLCSPECRGLCTQCGANRNIEPCNCAAQSRGGDERFKALEKLRNLT